MSEEDREAGEERAQCPTCFHSVLVQGGVLADHLSPKVVEGAPRQMCRGSRREPGRPASWGPPYQP